MEDRVSPRASVSSKRNAYFAFVLLFLLYMFDYIDRLVVVSLFPFLKKDWGLTDAQCGLLVSAVYWSILIFSLPVSVLVDRWSRKKSIGIMSILWSLATLACAFTGSFRQLFLARTAIGIGEAGYAPGGTAMISALFPPEQRAKLLGLWNSSIPLGSALGIALGGLIAEKLGWRHAFGLVALPGLVVTLLIFWVKDYKTVDLVRAEGPAGGGSKEKMSMRDIANELLRKPSLIFNNLGFASNIFVTTALLSWLPTFLHRVHGLPVSQAGIRGSVVMLLAIVGAPLGGYLTDLWLKRTRRARMLLPASTSVLSSLLLCATFFLFNGTSQYLALLVVGITIIMFVPAGVAVTQDVVHPGLRAVSLSLNIIIQHLLGSTLGPVFVGMLSDRFGIAAALSFLPLFCFAGGLLFFLGSFFYEKDLGKVTAIEVEMEE